MNISRCVYNHELSKRIYRVSYFNLAPLYFKNIALKKMFQMEVVGFREEKKIGIFV